MGSRVNFIFFPDGCFPEQSSTSITANTSFLLLTTAPPGVAWINLITPNGGRRGFPLYCALCSVPRFPESTINSFKYPVFTSCLDNLSITGIARWYAPCLCGKYSTSFGSSWTGHPPSCLAIGCMAHFLFGLRSYASAP